MLQISIEARLRTRIDFLEEENRQLRERLAALTGSDCSASARVAFGFTESEALIFQMLMRCGVAPYTQLIDTVYLDRYGAPRDPEWALRAHVKRMRRRLNPHNVKVGTIYGVGFYMDDKTRAKCKSIIDTARPHNPDLT